MCGAARMIGRARSRPPCRIVFVLSPRAHRQSSQSGRQANAVVIRASASSRRTAATVNEIRRDTFWHRPSWMIKKLRTCEQHDLEIGHALKVWICGDDGEVVFQRSRSDKR